MRQEIYTTLRNYFTQKRTILYTCCKMFSQMYKNVTEIGEYAFQGCSALKTIKVPEGMDVSKWGLGESVRVIYY